MGSSTVCFVPRSKRVQGGEPNSIFNYLQDISRHFCTDAGDAVRIPKRKLKLIGIGAAVTRRPYADQREQFGGWRVRFDNNQRRRLALS